MKSKAIAMQKDNQVAQHPAPADLFELSLDAAVTKRLAALGLTEATVPDEVMGEPGLPQQFVASISGKGMSPPAGVGHSNQKKYAAPAPKRDSAKSKSKGKDKSKGKGKSKAKGSSSWQGSERKQGRNGPRAGL